MCTHISSHPDHLVGSRALAATSERLLEGGGDLQSPPFVGEVNPTPALPGWAGSALCWGFCCFTEPHSSKSNRGTGQRVRTCFSVTLPNVSLCPVKFSSSQHLERKGREGNWLVLFLGPGNARRSVRCGPRARSHPPWGRARALPARLFVLTAAELALPLF